MGKTFSVRGNEYEENCYIAWSDFIVSYKI